MSMNHDELRGLRSQVLELRDRMEDIWQRSNTPGIPADPDRVAQILEGLLGKLTLPSFDELGDSRACSVCHEPFLTDRSPELPVKLSCGHVFGFQCLFQWLSPLSETPNDTCPMCRDTVLDIHTERSLQAQNDENSQSNGPHPYSWAGTQRPLSDVSFDTTGSMSPELRRVSSTASSARQRLYSGHHSPLTDDGDHYSEHHEREVTPPPSLQNAWREFTGRMDELQRANSNRSRSSAGSATSSVRGRIFPIDDGNNDSDDDIRTSSDSESSSSYRAHGRHQRDRYMRAGYWSSSGSSDDSSSS
ncbi:Ubiquitin-protein ligase [Lecanora helva]